MRSDASGGDPGWGGPSGLRYQDLVEQAYDIITLHDSRRRFRYISPNFTHRLGYEPEEVLGNDILSFVHADDRELAKTGLREMNRLGYTRKSLFRFRHRDGSWRWMETTSKLHVLEDGATYGVTISRDVSSRVEAEEALRASEQRFRVLTENAFDMISELDASGNLTYVSPNHADHLGYAPEEILGQNPTTLLHPDDVAKSCAWWQDTDSSSLAPILRIRRKDGRWAEIQTSGRPYASPSGENKLVLISRDVTLEHRNAREREKLGKKLQEVQHSESMAVLAGGVAHDFNNLLVGILGSADLAQSDLDPQHPAFESISQVLQSAAHAAELARQLLSYSGRGHAVFDRTELNELVKQTLELLDASVSKGVSLDVELHPAPLYFVGDPNQIRQVALNLVTNASEALQNRPSGRVVVRTLLEGTRACLEVEDNGVGIVPGVRERIFEPFFSTKVTGRGLGLAAARGIVRSHGGRISVGGTPGEGALFRVTLPISEAHPVEQGVARNLDQSATILVVDDESTVLEVATRMLERAGHRVLSASSGREALARFRDHADEIDCALVDFTMPEMDGRQTSEALHGIRPDLPIVLSSGYLEWEASFEDPFPIRFLGKPYRSDVLSRVVNEALAIKKAD